ncbi:Dihydrofolate reductase [Propionibacterium cyclohexanicum]|uniref:Dihydrofolate reductase n=1 Tax=Propionibacterium cyclohexanicum TaxID=64702 RepID=A0A1H9RF73_9ACTN|nr:dihydrofolate reductase family protein [Propionibacterium cyclohexanicum]SER71406.1 Dihydrofolate reductase [Propionibacterium cyclohexanicum]
MSSNRTWQGCVFVGASLDGFIARDDGDIAWLSRPRPRIHAQPTSSLPALTWEDFFPSIDVIVMGRATYELAMSFSQWPYEERPMIVLSHGLAEQEGHVEVARSVDDAVRAIERHEGRRVYVDGGQTIQSFLAAGLIDELTVAFAPVLLGKGIRLFGEVSSDILLTVRGSHVSSPDGLLRVTYDVA